MSVPAESSAQERPEIFAARLRLFLRRRFAGDLPSAAQVARALNLHDRAASPHAIVAETVRRWMRGLSTPDLQRFGQLCRFLELSPEEVCHLALIDLSLSGSVSATGHNGKRAAVAAPDIRALLHDLVDRAEGEWLAAAYLAYLATPSTHQNSALGGG